MAKSKDKGNKGKDRGKKPKKGSEGVGGGIDRDGI